MPQPNQDPNSLVGTLPPEKTLPIGSVDQLDLLRMALRDTSQLAFNRGMTGSGQGVLNKMESFGYKPENISGGTLGNIMQFVSEQTAAPIEKEFKTIGDILTGIRSQQDKLQAQKDKIRDDARTLMSNIASQAPDVFNKLTPDELTAIQGGDIPQSVYAKIGESASAERNLDIRYKELQNKKLEQDINNTGKNTSVGAALGLTGKMATDFDADLETEINNVYGGQYNRETALQKLQAQPKYAAAKDAIAGVIYGSDKFNAAFPDGYEKLQKKSEAEKKAEMPQFDESAMAQIAKTLVDSMGKEKAKQALGYRKITINKKQVDLTEATARRIQELVDQQEEKKNIFGF